MFAVNGRRKNTIPLAILLFLGGAAFWLYTQREDLNPPSWLLEQTPLPTEDTVPFDEPILGRTQDPGRLYFPPTSNTKPVKIATYAEVPTERPRTPLFIGFTNNNAMLYQCVLSYIAAGWPREDIIVVENTGTMDSNPLRKFSRDDYFYLDYAALHRHNISIIQTPALFTFAQLQNFYLRTSMAQGWKNFFWSHMDVIAVGDEDPAIGQPEFRPFYHRIVDVVKDVQSRHDWAIKWFSCTLGLKACDMLVLVNVEAWRKIGQWDQFIPYYATDCDAFSRMVLNGFSREKAGDHAGAGHVFDVGTLLNDPQKWLFPATPDEQPNSARFQRLLKKLREMEGQKLDGNEHRNDWQENHGKGGKVAAGSWGYDRKAFRSGWWSLSDAGRGLYNKKWGTDVCELETVGVKLKDMWKPLYDEDAKKAKEATS